MNVCYLFVFVRSIEIEFVLLNPFSVRLERCCTCLACVALEFGVLTGFSFVAVCLLVICNFINNCKKVHENVCVCIL